MNVSSQIEEVAIAFLGVATLAAGDLPISGLGERQETVEELHDRFKTWLGNIDVLPGGYKRLDECLQRASELRETVTELLQNLSDDLRDAQEAIQAPTDTPALEHAITNNPVSADVDSSGYSESLTFEMIAEDIEETLTCLMRLSVPLADHIVGELQMSSNRGGMDTRYGFDLRAEFPQASAFVTDRLSKAISDRRNALLPPEHRPSALDDQEPNDELQTRIEKGLKSEGEEGEANKILSAILRDVQPVLEARSDSMTRCDEDDLDDSSVSSAASVNTHRAETKDCGICHQEISYVSASELRKHYHHDLTPYVCLFQDCTLSGARYRSRSTWIEHIKSAHGKVWRCCFGCPQMLGSRDGFYQHLRTIHNVDLSPQELFGLAEMCEKHMLTDDGPRCPLCQELAGTGRTRYRHIARHLEKLAVFSLMPPGYTFKGNAPPTNPEVATNAQLASRGFRDLDQVGDVAQAQSDILSATNESAWDGRSDYTSNEGVSTLATSVQGDETSKYDIGDTWTDHHPAFEDEIEFGPLPVRNTSVITQEPSMAERSCHTSASSALRDPDLHMHVHSQDGVLRISPANATQTPEMLQESLKGTKIDTSPERYSMEKIQDGHISSSLHEWNRGETASAADKAQSLESGHGTNSQLEGLIEDKTQEGKANKISSPAPAQSSHNVAKDSTMPSSMDRITNQDGRLHVLAPGQLIEDSVEQAATSNRPPVVEATGMGTSLQPEHTTSRKKVQIPNPMAKTPEVSEIEKTPGMDKAQGSLEPSCAICGAPPYPECPHEAESLQRALQQAQDRWHGVQRIRDWVLDNSRNHIIRRFEHLKTVRYNAHLAYLQSLPYYSLYHSYNGQPPLAPRELQYLRGQLDNADVNLKLGVDQDWRSCCLLYPETLDYHFSLVSIRLPKDHHESVLRPEIGAGRKTFRRDSSFKESGGKRDKGRA